MFTNRSIDNNNRAEQIDILLIEQTASPLVRDEMRLSHPFLGGMQKSA